MRFYLEQSSKEMNKFYRHSTRTNYRLNLKLFSFLLMFGVSCANPNLKTSDTSPDSNINIEQIVVDGSDVGEADVSSLIEEISIVPLNEERGKIGEAFKLLKTKDYYIVFDRFIAKRINVYDNKGEFVKSVIEIGKGPEETLQLNDCWLNDGGNLEVYDFALKKVLVFDENFDLVNVIKGRQPLIFNALMRIPNSSDFAGYIGYNSTNDTDNGKHYKLAFLDSLIGVKSTDLHYDGEINGASLVIPVSPFLKYGDSIRFSQNFDSFIYDVSKDGLSKRYEILYTHKPFPLNYEDEIIKKDLALLKSNETNFNKINASFKGYTGYGGNWLETADYAYFESFDVDYKPFISIYNKKDKKVVAQGRFFRDNDRYKMILPPFLTTDLQDNRFISLWDGVTLKQLLSDDSPFWDLINKNLEANYIVTVKFKSY